ncbi:MAG: twin-arginine translocation signal domain-containing protein [Candidatus Hydrogenedentes bacterium]|nr:twin-arginine translocation signal domain-containing protein [Candidatus Hydrogenedentota bacterium]
MTRRDFMKATTAGAIASTAGAAAAEPGGSAGLPQTQGQPLPDLGTHWPIFEKLSAKCRPKMSFLEDKYTDPVAWAEEARAVLLADLHYAPEACDPAPEVTDRADLGAYIRERVMIGTTPVTRVPAYLLIPKDAPKPCPAVVCLHDHGGFYFWGKEKLVQIEGEHPALTEYKKVYYSGRSIADELAKRGFVTIVPDMLHWGERGLYLEDDPERIKKRTLDVTAQDILDFNARSWAHEELIGRTALTCGVTWPGILTWDDRRVTDYLLTRSEVDPKRVGCCGLSLGSVRSIYLGALHPAVRASAAICWMAEYQPMARNHVRNGIGFTKLVPGLYSDLDWPDVGGLHLPGCLLTVNGLQDKLYPLEAAKAAVDKLERIYAKAGASSNYEGVFFDGPHEFNAEMQEVAFAWLAEKLA